MFNAFGSGGNDNNSNTSSSQSSSSSSQSSALAPIGASALDARLNESSFTHIAILLSYFFGNEGLHQFKLKVTISCSFLALFAFASVIDMFTGGWVVQNLSIHSRTPSGLIGLIFAPFLHPSPAAAFIDCAPFLMLSLLVMFRPAGIQTFAVLVATNAILGGMVVWFLGRSATNHTGCGAMIFTLFGYLLLVGAVRRDVRSAIISVAVFLMYGGLLWALLPLRDRSLSWEGHLMGMTIGSVLGVYDGRVGGLGQDLADATSTSSSSSSSSTAGSTTPTAKKSTVKAGDVTEKTGLTAEEENDEA